MGNETGETPYENATATTEERSSTFKSMLSQIVAGVATAAAEHHDRRFNPRPPGVPQPGGATEAVLAVLVDSGAALTEGQLVWKTGKSRSAVTWAIFRLKHWQKIDVLSDGARNSRYCRYRAKKGV
jgi:hypothetical protein